MSVRILRNLGYPADLSVRDKIRAFHRLRRNDGKPWLGDRGSTEELEAGQIILSPPADLVESWIRDGLAEEVE
tara:strand:+ start:13886 stop:14104 length:219 start_codon:yes stop_codon:yes gene_type:complete